MISNEDVTTLRTTVTVTTRNSFILSGNYYLQIQGFVWGKGSQQFFSRFGNGRFPEGFPQILVHGPKDFLKLRFWFLKCFFKQNSGSGFILTRKVVSINCRWLQKQSITHVNTRNSQKIETYKEIEQNSFNIHIELERNLSNISRIDSLFEEKIFSLIISLSFTVLHHFINFAFTF